MNEIVIGFLGCGNVGGGVWNLLENFRKEIAHRNHLFQFNFLYLSNQMQQLSFSFSIHNISNIASGKFTILNLQLISIDIIHTKSFLKIFSEVSKSSR